MKNKPKGILGWLLVYVIFLSFRLLLAVSLLLILQIFDIYLILEIILVGIALFLIITKSKNAIKFNIAYLIIEVVILIIQNASKIAGSIQLDRANGVGAVMGALVFSIIWILYWIKSKRVKNTFIK